MKRIFAMGIFSAILGLFSCNAQSPDNAFKSVEVEEFAKVIADTTVIRLDVRTPEEYAEGHIDNAVNIDVQNKKKKKKAVSTLPKDKTIALYCRSGRRSKNAAKILSANGYNVVELNSGYNGWKTPPLTPPIKGGE